MNYYEERICWNYAGFSESQNEWYFPFAKGGAAFRQT